MVTIILTRICRIDKLIREGRTGTAAQLAHTIGVSERTIYQYIRQMKMAGAPIAFDVHTKNYYYKEEGRFNCAFSFASAVDNPSSRLQISVASLWEYMRMMNDQFKINYN
jgi:predicted metal-dependent phosphotriesterase family hydrolase